MTDHAIGIISLGIGLLSLVFPGLLPSVSKRVARLIFGFGVLFIVYGIANTLFATPNHDRESSGISAPENSGIVTQGQTGGTNTINDYGPRKIEFNDTLKGVLLRRVPRDKPIEVRAVGSFEDQLIGEKCANFLEKHGYVVHLRYIATIIPIPSTPLTITEASITNILVVDPSISLKH